MSSPKDANDYSRFEDIKDGDEENELSTTAPDQSSLLKAISKAQIHKERGNQYFKENSLKLAKESYEDGLLLLDDLKSLKAIESLPNKALQDDARNLIVSFYNNLSMISIKEESWYRALTNTNKAVELDPTNVKCLYRRAVANSRLSQHDEAISDLNKVLSLDPSNSSAKKELIEVTKAQKEQRKKESASFGKIFSKGTSLYDDREKERSNKIKRQEEQKAKEEMEWKQSNEEKLAQGLIETEQSFDEWKKEKEEEAKKKKEEEEKKRKEVSAPSSSAPPKLKVPNKEANSVLSIADTSAGDEELYDEEEKKIMEETKAKGYCYFKETSAKMEQRSFTPKSIEPSPNPASDTPATPRTTHTPMQVNNGSGGVTTSTWNYAGTWEERDLTETAKQKLQDFCLSIKNLDMSEETNSSNEVKVVASVSAVNKLEGDAQIVMTRGKKRHLYDFNVKLDFEINISEKNLMEVSADSEGSSTETINGGGFKKSYKGSLTYGEVAPESSLESTIKWKKVPSGIYEDHAKNAVQRLHHEVQMKLRHFESEYSSL